MSFPDLDAELQQAVSELGFTQMTPIQEAAIPPLLAGRDLIGRSKTGSGKTAAFGLPLLQRIRRGERRLQGLVLCPTRELAAQVTADLRALGKRCPGLRVISLVGGQPGGPQAAALSEGVHIVVGTPGRTLDHLRRRTLRTDAISVVVLDEADRMLELGFADEMAAILEALPETRQTALFSATYPEKLEKLTAGWLRDPVRVEIVTPSTGLDAAAVVVEEPEKDEVLGRLLRALQPASALVFRNLKVAVAETAEKLGYEGFDAAALHGDLEQVEREQVLARFRNGSIRVLIATDVAARGLDIAGLDLVVNVDLPVQSEDYVHRVGRTGRAGRPGVAWSLVTAKQVKRLEEMAIATSPVTMREVVGEGPPLVSAMVTLEVSAGRKDKFRPGDLLGALTGDCGLAGSEVGKIEIHDRWTFVAIGKASAGIAAEGLTRHGVKGRRVKVNRLW